MKRYQIWEFMRIANRHLIKSFECDVCVCVIAYNRKMKQNTHKLEVDI